MFEKTKQLRQMVADNLSPDSTKHHPIEEIDALHLEINNARRDCGWEVAKGIRKKHTGAHAFTPLVKKLLAESVLWSKVIWFRSKRKKNK